VRGGAEIEYLGEGMVDLLSTKLDGAGELRSVDARALLAALEGAAPDIQRARQVARRYGAGLVVLGNIVEVSGRLQLSASVYETGGGASITSARAEGQTDGIFELVDDMAAQMLGDLRGGPGARVRQIAAVTTSSLPALKFYLAGEQAYRAGEFEPAVEAFQQAISKDSAFALAHYRLSLAAEWLARTELSFDAAKAADRHAARLSERDRRLLEALLVWRRGEARRAEDLYRAHVGAYSDDVEGWFQLGEVLFHGNPPRGRSVMEARPAFEEVLTLEPNHTQAAVHMARMAAGERNLEELDSLVEVQVRTNPESDRALEMLALQAFSHRDKNQEREVTARLEHTNDVTLIIAAWSVALFTDNLNGAERLARLLAAPSRPRELTALGHAWLAHLLLARGRWKEARQEFTAVEAADPALALEARAQLAAFDLVPGDREKLALRAALESMDAEAVPPSESPNVFFSVHNDLHPALRVYLLGLLSVGLGDPAAARQLAAQLEIMSAPPSSEALTSDWARGIRALVLRSEGRVSEALGTLEETRIEAWLPNSMASPFFSQAFQRFLRAELLREAGKPREAIEWYRHLVGTSPFELCLLPLALYGQAQAYETLGDLDQAAEYYAGFIELWAHADEEYQPRVQAAQQRLEEIVAERG
jgi:tetratricopeptide (TPR) repeat protein